MDLDGDYPRGIRIPRFVFRAFKRKTLLRAWRSYLATIRVALMPDRSPMYIDTSVPRSVLPSAKTSIDVPRMPLFLSFKELCNYVKSRIRKISRELSTFLNETIYDT